MDRARPVAIAGAGIAGLTCALAFAARGFSVTIFERSPKLEDIGAGLQLSPNATHVLSRLGVLPLLEADAVKPEAIDLLRATSLRKVASVPLGDAAEQRWAAPYLTIHRADLQRALVSAVEAHPSISLQTGTTVVGCDSAGSLRVAGDDGEEQRRDGFQLVVAADGVWSTLRHQMRQAEPSRYSGYMAWRAVLDRTTMPTLWMPPSDRVTTFLSGNFHLVAYPLRGGELLNLVALAKSPAAAAQWANASDSQQLARLMRGAHKDLLALVKAAGPWTTWPLHEVAPDGAWVSPEGVVLIGDAAHAMTPFAAQGAAMAIEDAVVLADAVARFPNDRTAALHAYQASRVPRVQRAARRGAFNRFAWNATGPIALGRDVVLSLRPAQSLAADMDWLYGWREPTV